jgi:3-phosphoshikimate 1-carboxyvinyltransferase
MILLTEPAASSLQGELTPPGDKSISHRALIMSCLAEGQSTVEGLLVSEDVLATASACRQLGMTMRKEGGVLLIDGVGGAGLSAPDAPLDMGNSGTAMRLLAGVLAAQPFRSSLIGDPSLSGRPMNRWQADEPYRPPAVADGRPDRDSGRRNSPADHRR